MLRRKYWLYHGTSIEAAKNILEHGFKESKNGSYGPGVYFFMSFSKALEFAEQEHMDRSTVIEAELYVWESSIRTYSLDEAQNLGLPRKMPEIELHDISCDEGVFVLRLSSEPVRTLKIIWPRA